MASKAIWTATTAIAGLIEGEKITSDETLARYFRALVKEENNTDIAQTDIRVREIFNQHDINEYDDVQEFESAVVDALVTDNDVRLGSAQVKTKEDNAISAVERNSLLSTAAMVAAKISAETYQTMDQLVIKKQDILNGARGIRILLERDLGKDQMNDLPLPGTTAKDVFGTNHRPDRYKFKALDVETGKEKTVSGSFFQDLYLSGPGQHIAAKIKGIKAANSKSVTAPPEYLAMNRTERTKLLRQLESSQTYRLSLIRDAVRLWNQETAINSIPGVTLKMIFDKVDGKDKPTTSPTCYVLIGDASKDEYEFYTVSQLFTIKPQWCTRENILANGGAFTAVKISGARMLAENKEKTGGLKTTEQAFTIFMPLVNFLDDADNRGAFTKELLKTGNEAMVKTFGDFMHDMTPVWNSVREKYNRLVEAESKAQAEKLAAEHNAKVQAQTPKAIIA